jgi:hypothetical protein
MLLTTPTGTERSESWAAVTLCAVCCVLCLRECIGCVRDGVNTGEGAGELVNTPAYSIDVYPCRLHAHRSSSFIVYSTTNTTSTTQEMSSITCFGLHECSYLRMS